MIVTCNHHDKSECTLVLGKPTKFHICRRTLLYYLPIMVDCHVWFNFLRQNFPLLHQRIASRPWFALRKFNLVSELSLDLRSTSITNLSASLGLQTANRNSNEMFWLIVEYFSPFASSWDSCWSAKTEAKAITEMIATTSKSNNALLFGGKSNKSFDNKSSSTFQLVVAYVDWLSNVISARAKCPSSHESSCASLLAVRAKCLNSHKSSCTSQIVAHPNCLNKSNVFAFRLLIVEFIQQPEPISARFGRPLIVKCLFNCQA